MLAERIEQRWIDALVSLRQYAGFQSEGWRRTAALVDLTRERLGRFDDPESLAEEYLAVVLLRRVRIDDPTTQTSPFVRDAGFALRYVELQTGARLSATALPPWLGEWAVV
ncbi:MAG TPA: hypothetical protein VG370_27785 [Chloroflexota bacterium]|nr:hypothetical protein [Chloroflexota bacterium]